jgi:1-piperideine-2-carboxylate/1-pyrroline-2-carboxylate reductase [NAD(P)H]
MILDASQTAALLPYALLAIEIERILLAGSAQVPERIVMPLAGGASLFVMPATDGRIAMTKLISFTPANASQSRATIQGNVVVFDVATGERIAILDGPTITARRTAAVSLLAAQRLAPNTAGPLLIVGAGVQGRAHLEAFAQGLGIQQVVIASRSAASAEALAAHARSLGLQASVTQDPTQRCKIALLSSPARPQMASCSLKLQETTPSSPPSARSSRAWSNSPPRCANTLQSKAKSPSIHQTQPTKPVIYSKQI